MKNQRISTTTMSDIAYHAKVSEATVCRALNNSPLVSSETYSKIISVAKALNYRVNKHASALRKMHSNQVLLVNCTRKGLAPVDNFLYLSWLNHFLYKADYVPLLSQLDTDKKLTCLPENISAEAIIFLQQPNQQIDKSALDTVLVNKPPLIFLGGGYTDNIETHCNAHRILSDDYAAAYYLTSRLIAMGCYKLVYIEDTNNRSINRYNGYRQCMKDHFLQYQAPIQLTQDSLIENQTINLLHNSEGFFLSSNRLHPIFENFTKTSNKITRPKTVTIIDDSQITTENCVEVAHHSIESMCRLAIHSLLKENHQIETSTSLVTMTYGQ